MPTDITLSCTCGKLSAVLHDAGPRSGTHLVCHCDDCRAANTHLGVPAPVGEGVDLFQTSPEKLEIVTGGENLEAMRLSPKGPLRWYAKCCGTPMFNTLASPRLPFVGVHTAVMDAPEAIGPVRAQAFLKGKDGKARHKGMMPLVAGLFKRMAVARLSGRWRDTPFFDAATLEPVVPPHVISREERAAATRR